MKLTLSDGRVQQVVGLRGKPFAFIVLVRSYFTSKAKSLERGVHWELANLVPRWRHSQSAACPTTPCLGALL